MMLINDIKRIKVNDAVLESLKYHAKLYIDAKKGKKYRGFDAVTVISWYKNGGSRHHLLVLAEKDLSKLTVKEVNEILSWHPILQNCGNPCRTCGNLLSLDNYFWFIPLSFCDNDGCGIQLCPNCLYKIKGIK